MGPRWTLRAHNRSFPRKALANRRRGILATLLSVKELSKSVHRRLRDPLFTTKVLQGQVLDVGGAPDPLTLYISLFPLIQSVRVWDLPDGDAQLLEGLEDSTFDCVHSSHCLEHLTDPFVGLQNWFRVTRPGGYLVVTVPDEDLYEQGTEFPAFNSDHKWTFTIWKSTSWSSVSINVVDLLKSLGEEAAVLSIHLEDSGYRYGLPVFDQTRTPIAESAIEFVVRKRLPHEMQTKGRLPIETTWPAGLKPHFDQYSLDQDAARQAYPRPFTNA